jgi:hypothetical protein
MYDYFLGGKDHFPADRAAAERVIAAYPRVRSLAMENRRFLERAVQFVAGQGIRQFVDLGTGLPTSPNVHEVAQGIHPGARVVYVDNDPVVTVHSRVLCDGAERVAVIDGDIRRPEAILASAELTDLIDLSKPVAFLCVAVLHFITEDEDPGKILAALRRRMAAGSYLIISHATSDGADRHVFGQVMDAYEGAVAPPVYRTEAAIRDMFSGLELAEPGVTDVARWHSAVPGQAGKVRVLGGVGRMPHHVATRF